MPPGFALHDCQSVEQAALPPVGAPMRLNTHRHHDQGRLARAERTNHTGEFLLTQEVLSDRGWIQDAGPKVQEIARTRGNGNLGARQRPRGLVHRDARLGKRAHIHQAAPVERREGQPVNPLGSQDATPCCQRAGGAQDAVADDPGRDGRAADDVGRIRCRCLGRCKLQPLKATDIGCDILIRNSQRQYRFVVLDQLCATDPSGWCDGDQHVER